MDGGGLGADAVAKLVGLLYTARQLLYVNDKLVAERQRAEQERAQDM